LLLANFSSSRRIHGESAAKYPYLKLHKILCLRGPRERYRGL
jgi:hypothetical protein